MGSKSGLCAISVLAGLLLVLPGQVQPSGHANAGQYAKIDADPGAILDSLTATGVLVLPSLDGPVAFERVEKLEKTIRTFSVQNGVTTPGENITVSLYHGFSSDGSDTIALLTEDVLRAQIYSETGVVGVEPNPDMASGGYVVYGATEQRRPAGTPDGFEEETVAGEGQPAESSDTQDTSNSSGDGDDTATPSGPAGGDYLIPQVNVLGQPGQLVVPQPQSMPYLECNNVLGYTTGLGHCCEEVNTWTCQAGKDYTVPGGFFEVIAYADPDFGTYSASASSYAGYIYYAIDNANRRFADLGFYYDLVGAGKDFDATQTTIEGAFAYVRDNLSNGGATMRMLFLGKDLDGHVIGRAARPGDHLVIQFAPDSQHAYLIPDNDYERIYLLKHEMGHTNDASHSDAWVHSQAQGSSIHTHRSIMERSAWGHYHDCWSEDEANAQVTYRTNYDEIGGNAFCDSAGRYLDG